MKVEAAIQQQLKDGGIQWSVWEQYTGPCPNEVYGNNTLAPALMKCMGTIHWPLP